MADWRTGLRHREVLHVGIVVAALGLILGAGLAMMGWPAGASGFLVAAGGGVCLASPLVRVLEVRRPDRPGEAVAVVAGLVAVAGLVTHIVVWGMVYVIDRASAAAGGVPLTWRQAGPALAATAGLATLLSLWQAAGRPRTGRVARAAVLGWVGNAALIALVPFGLAMAAVAGGVGAEVTRDAVAREAGPGLSRGGLGIVATLAGVAAVFGGTVALVWFAPSLVFRLALWTLPRDGDPDGPGGSGTTSPAPGTGATPQPAPTRSTWPGCSGPAGAGSVPGTPTPSSGARRPSPPSRPPTSRPCGRPSGPW